MKVKVESEKVGLKLNIQKTKNMASGPITSWEIDGETVETVSDFIFWVRKWGDAALALSSSLSGRARCRLSPLESFDPRYQGAGVTRLPSSL